MQRSGEVLVAGGGIAGLTAALAFARRGFSVRVFEGAAELQELGAGLQISPNATRILRKLGVLDLLLVKATRPEDVRLVDASNLSLLGRVRLGRFAEQRWGSPYLVAHRADLQGSLLSCFSNQPGVEIVTGAVVSRPTFTESRIEVRVDRADRTLEAAGDLLVAADGVWSRLRGATGSHPPSRFSGSIAWRASVPLEGSMGTLLEGIARQSSVTVLVHPSLHLVAYPLRCGKLVNLVAVTAGESFGSGWSLTSDVKLLQSAAGNCAPAIRQLVRATQWSTWPIHTVAFERPWTVGGQFALIGDAAHAMTPFSAQGAAMAIEDGDTLAEAFASAGPDKVSALARWETGRRIRIAKVARRGALNRFAWNAGGLIALARNLVLRTRSAESLATDLDWLYGWRGEP